MKKVLSTKTLDSDTLAYAQTLQLDVQCMDFIETTAFPFKLELFINKNFDALAFTSASAVKFFFEIKAPLPLPITNRYLPYKGKRRKNF